MALLKVVHVAPDDGGWKVVRDGQTQSVHRTQRAAIIAGRSLAMKTEAELVAHDRHGGVRLKDSSPLIRREILEGPGQPSVSRSKIAAAARFAFRDRKRSVPSRSSERRAVSTKSLRMGSTRKQRAG